MKSLPFISHAMACMVLCVAIHALAAESQAQTPEDVADFILSTDGETSEGLDLNDVGDVDIADVVQAVFETLDPFNTTESMELAGGTYHFTELNAPAGVTVTLLGDVG